MSGLNEDILKGKWKDIKGEIRNQWGKLTGDDLERTKGNQEAISGLIQEKYGHKKEEISTKLKDIWNRFDNSADRGAEQFKSNAAETTEVVKNKLREH